MRVVCPRCSQGYTQGVREADAHSVPKMGCAQGTPGVSDPVLLIFTANHRAGHNVPGCARVGSRLLAVTPYQNN